MMNNINLLVNGCSFSRGSTSWPYHLKGVNITNLACAGAGNTYIHDSTISELSLRKYDFVAIMWTGIARIDLTVSDIDMFNESTYTSKFQSSKNDWSGKIIYPVNDQDYVEKNWVFGCGHLNNEKSLKDTKIFEKIYFYKDTEQFINSFLINLISLQSILKNLRIPYLFMYYDNYENELKKIPNLYSMLDQTCVYNKKNIYTITKENNWYDDDGIHPGEHAHKKWAELINPLITK